MDHTAPVELDIGDLIESHDTRLFNTQLLGWSLVLMVFEGFDMQVLAFAAPLLSDQWGIPPEDLGPVFGAGLFGYMLGATALTEFADRYGRKIVITCGALWFGTFTLVSVAAESTNQLLVLRFLAGLGLGASIPTLLALNAEYAPSRSRGRRITALYVGYCVGGMLGGFLAAKLLPAYGWQSVFIVGGVAPITLSIVLHFYLPESVRLLVAQKRKSHEILAVLRRLVPERTFSGAECFIVREEHSLAGPAVRHLYAHGRAATTILLWLAFIMSLLGHHFITAWLPSVLENAGLSLSTAVTAGGLLMGGAAVGCVLCGWLLDRWGMLTVAQLFLLSIPTVAAIGFASSRDATLLVLVFLTGVFLLGAQVGLNALASGCYPTYIRSSGAGWALGVGRIGSIAGPIIGGLMIGTGISLNVLFLYAALPALCCAFLIFFLWRIRKEPLHGS